MPVKSHSNPLGALLSCDPGTGHVEVDITAAGYRVISTTKNKTELDSSGASLDDVFRWELVVAQRSWKRVNAADGKPAGKWIPAWEEGAKDAGWLIPPSPEERTKAATKKE